MKFDAKRKLMFWRVLAGLRRGKQDRKNTALQNEHAFHEILFHLMQPAPFTAERSP